MPRPRPAPGPDILEVYAAHLGIPIQDPPRGDYPAWDGSALLCPVNTEGWAHEIAHWLLATPERRRLVDYGWGQDVEFAGYDPADPVPYAYGPRPDLDGLPWPEPADCPETSEEILASVLGFALMVRVGADVTAVYDAYGFYQYTWMGAAGETTRSVEVSTYGERRMVQGHVVAFEEWLGAYQR